MEKVDYIVKRRMKVEDLKYDSMDFSGSDEDVVYQMREIAQSLEAMRRGQLAGPSLESCEECGDDIPEARRMAIEGCRTCIYCQAELEKGR